VEGCRRTTTIAWWHKPKNPISSDCVVVVWDNNSNSNSNNEEEDDGDDDDDDDDDDRKQVVALDAQQQHANTDCDSSSRRTWLRTAVAGVTTLATVPCFSQASGAAEALPSALRGYTKLAPLGPKEANGGSGLGKAQQQQQQQQFEKTTGLSPDEMARRLTIDLVEGSRGRGGYFLTGDLSKDLFRDDCVFEDPTNRVDSLRQYQKALTLLFDPDRSSVELLGNGLSVSSVRETEPSGGQFKTIITGRLRSRGFLRVAPWKPYVRAYETTITYTLDPISGLVARQDQEWTKDATTALRETFTPSWNGSPPQSFRERPPNEPDVVTALFEVLNGRRPGEYSLEERREIDERIERIVGMAAEPASPPSSSAAATAAAAATATATTASSSSAPGLIGTWVLVYLQPGPGGAGIDRRIPFFPDFDFNDSFQIFSSSSSSSSSFPGGTSSGAADTVTNVGQVLGSLADVRVSGSLRELATTTTPSGGSPPLAALTFRRFEATIEGGGLCFGEAFLLPSPEAQAGAAVNSSSSSCPINLPMIRGRGIFDSLYLGDRLRIGRNINGGGARVVQVRL
jgi:hypothetical protein